VVAEVQANDRWRMFDADYGVFYHNSLGEIASFAEISHNPNLIIHPVNPIYPVSDSAYSQALYNIYSDVQYSQSLPPQAGKSRGMNVSLPPDSEFIFPVQTDPDTFFQDGALPSDPLFYLAQIRIPYVKVNTLLNLPLFMVGASGKGQIEFGAQVYDIGSQALHAYFAQFANDTYPDPIKTVLIYGGARNVVISMSLSAFVVDGLLKDRIEISQTDHTRPVYVEYFPSKNQTPSGMAQFLSSTSSQLFSNPSNFVSPVSTGPEIDLIRND
jgi:hypothetical protein